MTINFSPHTKDIAAGLLGAISDRIDHEETVDNGSVLFAVMQLTGSDTPVYNTLNQVFSKQSFFSYGISDSPAGTHLYAAGSKAGVLVTGKVGQTKLPAPFDQVRVPPGHEIHDKFVVCGLNGADPAVYCGSSNLASGGENQNGDNLLEIHDADVATAFAIEALLLVDHYNFLDRYAQAKSKSGAGSSGGKPAKKPSSTKSEGKKTSGSQTPANKAPATKKSLAKITKKAPVNRTRIPWTPSSQQLR